jgi:hypothetical protein
MNKDELFEKWVNSIDISLSAWQKGVLRTACTQPHKELYIAMPRHNGRYMVYKLVEQFEQMIKEKEMSNYMVYKMAERFEQMIKEKEMSNKMKEFDIKDVHSGYVVKFRNNQYAMCTRVGEKFTKIFTCTDLRAIVSDPKEGVHFFYTSKYKGNAYYEYNPVHNRTENKPEFDIIEVYGLINGVKNYLEVGNYCVTYRPLLWKEDVVEMTLEDIEKKLGHKVRIIDKEKPHIICEETCKKCVHYGKNECGEISCDTCKSRYGWNICKCAAWREGEPCPHFKEVE